MPYLPDSYLKVCLNYGENGERQAEIITVN
jgi:tRNA threonylcarbamoyladenosine biosynthesis protein TsaE